MFTKSQRLAIRQRDENKCQAPFKHKCGGRFEIHHVIPQRYSRTVLGLTDVEIDTPYNALNICKNAHRIIHPDLDSTLLHYKELKKKGREPFQDMSRAREDKLKHHVIYWNDRHDRLMLTMAYQRTQKAYRAGWKFPLRRRKK